MLKIEGGASIPLFQMISQRHTARFISFWLEECFNKMPILPSPGEVVCDDSKALLLAFVKTFTIFHSVKEYIRACIGSVDRGSPPPGCYIRLDRSHFVKNLIRKVANKDVRKRDLFRSIFGYLIQCEDFKQAKEIILDFFTLILNKFVGSNSAGELPAEKSKKRLLALCATHKFDLEIDENEIEKTNREEDQDEEENFETVEPDDAWLQEIIGRVQIQVANDQNSTDSTDNIYYNEYEKEKYIKVLLTIPMWSNIMNQMFGSQFLTATSQDVESNFKTLKYHVLDQKMVRPDKFLAFHVPYLKTEYNLRMAEGMTAIKTKKFNPGI